jgi:hypothetical protein
MKPAINFHCNTRFKFILNRRICDGEFICEGFSHFPALAGFADRRNRRYNDYSRREQGDPAQQRRQAVGPLRTCAPERDHSRIESKRHRDRNLFGRLRGRSQQPIDFVIFHNFSLAEILAN